MSTDLTAAVLSTGEARTLTDEVREDAAALWAKLLRLYEGGAHTALGYASWGAYYETEFGQSGTHGYRLLDSARVASIEVFAHSPIGESVARALAPVLKEDGPERVEEVWGEVVEEHGPTPTAAQVREVVAAQPKDLLGPHLARRARESQAAGIGNFRWLNAAADDLRQSPDLDDLRFPTDRGNVEHLDNSIRLLTELVPQVAAAWKAHLDTLTEEAA